MCLHGQFAVAIHLEDAVAQRSGGRENGALAAIGRPRSPCRSRSARRRRCSGSGSGQKDTVGMAVLEAQHRATSPEGPAEPRRRISASCRGRNPAFIAPSFDSPAPAHLPAQEEHGFRRGAAIDKETLCSRRSSASRYALRISRPSSLDPDASTGGCHRRTGSPSPRPRIVRRGGVFLPTIS